MATFACEYVYDTSRLAEQDEVRPSHRAYLASLHEQGSLVASGPWVDEAPGALIVMRANSASEVEDLLSQDPFQRHGFVTHVTVREWNPVIGSLA